MIEIENRIINKSNIICLLLIGSIFSIDRFSKIKIINYILDSNSSIYVNNYLNLDLVWNTGIGFGFLSLEGGTLYHLISFIIFIVILGLIYFIIKSSLKSEKLLFSMILGGALGNFYDRCTYFAVPDFIDIHYKDFHWFTFNIADIFITVGIVLLISKDLIFKK